VVARIIDLMRFCETLPGADVEATCAFGTARVPDGDSSIVICARAETV